jgi:radical SAM-linked protein
LAIQYAVEGDLRFISHHDSLRLFERALARAGISVRYSEGFNPKPRLRIALPRSVGVASKDELLLVELASEATPDEVLRSLKPEMPPSLELSTVELLDDGDRRLPCEVWYSLAVDGPLRESLTHAASRLLSQEHVLLRRSAPGAPSKSVDIRPYISTIEIGHDRVTWSQKITPEGTARPGEVLEQLGLPSQDHLHWLCRLKVLYER